MILTSTQYSQVCARAAHFGRLISLQLIIDFFFPFAEINIIVV